ncbi:MAG: SLBB domain-containing protein [Armatimonadetes bacterium]|nr:SLBB domain-containing protein [Armatimonadota bacterium]
MPGSAFLLAYSLVASFAPAVAPAPAKIKVGDLLTVKVFASEEFSGDYAVLDDGSVTGLGFGRVPVIGLTLTEAKVAITKALSGRLNNPSVEVIFKLQRPNTVYVLNVGGTAGAVAGSNTATMGGIIPLQPGMTIRKLLASVQLTATPDELSITLTRQSKTVIESVVRTALDTGGTIGNTLLEPDDIVTIQLLPYVRIWMTGSVRQPGQIQILEGTDIYQALARSGGILEMPEDDYQLLVRRGPEIIEIPKSPIAGQPAFQLETGDTVDVHIRPKMRIAIMGEVSNPGEYVMREGTPIQGVVAKAGGLTRAGTLRNTIILRKGEAVKLDASGLSEGRDPQNFLLADGDVVYVRNNERAVTVLGKVRDPGVYYMEDGKPLRAADALAQAKGLLPSNEGSLRRVFLARAGTDGKMKIVEFNLDDYVKNGKLDANPELMPDDILLFGAPKNLVISDLSTFLSPLILLDSLLRRR